MKFRSLFSLLIVFSFFSAFGMDSRMTREIVIDTNNLLDVSLCRPGLITAADVGITGLTITTSGVYLLAENISFSPVLAASAITIDSDDVQLDLQCFSLSQGNAVADVSGIEVATGHSNILVKDGIVTGFTGDGIFVNDDNTIIRCNNVRVQQCSQGIFLSGSMADPIEKFFIKNCSFILNGVGFSANWANAGNITNCSSLMSEEIGFELLNSFSNKFIACKAEDTMSTTTDSTYGFFVNGGAKNTFKKLCVDGTTTNATFTGDTATGFYIGPDEDELVLKQSHISNSITTSNAQPFGVQMDYTFTALSDAGLPTFTHGTIVLSVNWSSDGRFLALGGGTAGGVQVEVLEFDGASLKPVATFAHGTNIQSVYWSPDGRYFAIGGVAFGGVEVQVLAFNGTSLTSVATFMSGASISSVNWSPDGRFLAIGGSAGGGVEVQILEFDGTSLTSVATFVSGAAINSVNWSPDGRFLGIGVAIFAGIDVQVLEFDGTSLTSVATFMHGDTVSSVNWSPDGRFLAIGGVVAGGVDVEV